ncbi:MAG: hypothetical protein JW819_00755 [Candidatus Krumholzibacteriota bacterium]|nr:hypothetical protein [Candidatus Krumholzibacteriota bacterium]
MLRALYLACALLVGVTGCRDMAADLDSLQQGQVVEGFVLQNLYVNGDGRVMGARLMAERHGFLVDLLQIQSVPQGFMWVKTPVRDDRGEPHACEHLLLGKGSQGRYVSNLEDMTLGGSSAWTSRLSTVYHFHVLAGEAAFYETLEARLNALLNPDFTDEEIRREVCHLGVTEDPSTGRLTLEEKGTVYTEMVSAFEGPSHALYDPLAERLYGKDHPVANASGGQPDSMRTMVPADMWAFHQERYHPANMGLITAIPREMDPRDFLRRLGGILDRVWPDGDTPRDTGIAVRDLPPARPAAAPGELFIAGYPAESEQDPGQIALSWPADRDPDPLDAAVADLFMGTFAGGPGSNLYDAYINSATRSFEIEANAVFGSQDGDFGQPLGFGFRGVRPADIEEGKLRDLRAHLIGEIRKVHDMADGSEELGEFNRRATSLLVNARKGLEDALNQPPMFGFRSFSCGRWQRMLAELERQEGFRKSLVYAPLFTQVQGLLDSGENFWRGYIDRWGLLDRTPVLGAILPDPGILAAAEAAKQARLAAHIAEFEERYGTGGEQESLARFKAEFDATTAELEAAAAGDAMPRFIDDPPLTLDDPLDYLALELPGGAPLVAATFDNMTTATLGLALRLDVLPADMLHLVPLLTEILTEIGVVMDGEVIDDVTMRERLRHELTRYVAYTSSSEQTGRVELVLRGTMSGSDEQAALLKWMRASLESPYLDEANLPRLRDVADQALTSLRTTMQGRPEYWVRDPATAWRMQDHPLFLAAESFLTRCHLMHRLSWLLREPGSEVAAAAMADFLDAMAVAGEGRDRAGLEALLDAPPLPPEAAGCGELAARAVDALRQCLAEVPDAELAADWRYLCGQMKSDLMTPPAEILAGLQRALDLVRRADNARWFLTSSTAAREALLPGLRTFSAAMAGGEPSRRQRYGGGERVFARMKGRCGLTERPHYIGLVNEGTRNGVLVFRARNAEPWDTREDKILDALSVRTYSGGGAHGIFMKTWAAGLAYSNGYGYGDGTGNGGYYAERCPDVAQTMRFVVGVLKEAEVDERLVEYAVAGVFGASRAAGRYEDRGEAMAADLADGVTPERVRAYREKVLAMRARPGLAADLAARMPRVYGQVLIGYGPPLAESREGNFFLIGPEPQFVSLEEYIATVEAPQAVHRLYPRDFWLVD